MGIHQGTSFVSMRCITGMCLVSSITPAIPTSRFIRLLKMGTIEFTILPCSPSERSNRTKSFVLIIKVKKRSKSRPGVFVPRRIAAVGYLGIEDYSIRELLIAGSICGQWHDAGSGKRFSFRDIISNVLFICFAGFASVFRPLKFELGFGEKFARDDQRNKLRTDPFLTCRLCQNKSDTKTNHPAPFTTSSDRKILDCLSCLRTTTTLTTLQWRCPRLPDLFKIPPFRHRRGQPCYTNQRLLGRALRSNFPLYRHLRK